MTRLSNGPLQMLAVGLFSLTGLAAATPMADFVDCSDGFWNVVCHDNVEPADEPDVVIGEANVEPADEPDVVIGELIQIDNDPVCTELDGGYIICHT